MNSAAGGSAPARPGSLSSASSARRSPSVWTTSTTPWTSVYSRSDEPCRFARSASYGMNRVMNPSKKAIITTVFTAESWPTNRRTFSRSR